MTTQCETWTPDAVEFGIMPIYPTQKAVAFKINYGRNWKCGQSPERVKLGFVLYPIDAFIEDGELGLRCAFPDANAVRHYDQHGQLFCAGSL